MDRDIIVVGAGVAGLTAAHELTRAGFDVIVLEKDQAVGGRARRERRDGFVIDPGAGFITNRHTNTQRILSDLGLSPTLISLHNKSSVLLHSRLSEFGLSRYWISAPTVLRMARTAVELVRQWNNLDLHAFERASVLDVESAAAYCARHLTSELLEEVVQPALAATFFWTPENTSAAMLFLLLKAWVNMKRFTLHAGLGQLPETLGTSVEVRCGTEVESIREISDHSYHVTALSNGRRASLRTRAVVCAVEAPHVRAIVEHLTPSQEEFFRHIRYAPALIVALATKGRPLSEFQSIFVPRNAKQSVYLGNVTSLALKNPGQVPGGCDLLRLYVRPEKISELWNESDDMIRSVLVEDLSKACRIRMGREVEEFCRVYRWKYAVPEFGVGYFHQLGAFIADRVEREGLVFAGDYLSGPWIEGAVTSGLTAAHRLSAFLK